MNPIAYQNALDPARVVSLAHASAAAPAHAQAPSHAQQSSSPQSSPPLSGTTGSPLLPSSLAQAELVYAETEQLAVAHQLESHAHSCHELAILLRGTLSVHAAEKTLCVQPGEAILIPRGEVHEETPASDEPVLRVVIGVNWSGYDDSPPLHLHDRGGRLHELAAWLSVERHATFPRANEYRRALAFSAVAEFERLRFDASSAIEKRTRAYIMSRLSKHISLEDMAKNAGMSRHHFSRLYRRVTGQTPTEYLRSLRLERARHLIRTTPQPLKVVAAQVGLASEHHLSRLLRKSFGVGVRDLRGRSHNSSRPEVAAQPD